MEYFFSNSGIVCDNERKIGREELTGIKSEIENELEKLEKLMEAQEKAERKRRLQYASGAVPVNCVSCRDNAMQKQHPYQNLKKSIMVKDKRTISSEFEKHF